MRYAIHRGQYEIGGMCIEVEANDGSRILLDLGMPLSQPDGSDFERGTPQRPTAELIERGVLKDIRGLYADDAPAFLAVVVTHSHLDHYGLAHHAHPDIPVYGSLGTIAILEVGRVFFPWSSLPKELHVLPERLLELGPFSVTAIPVDHAAPDSRALLVEADGQRLLYTGDLRAHGRTGFRFDNLLADSRIRSVDWLLIEGTTLASPRGSHGLRAERDVEDSLVQLALGEQLVAVVASGQNLDRLVSCLRAARRSGRQLVVDPYQAFILTRLAPLSKAIPQFTWNDVRISFAPNQVQRLLEAGFADLVYEMGREAKLTSYELAEAPSRYLLSCRGSYGVTKLLDKVGPGNVDLVWSMWKGYWERDDCAMRQWATDRGIRPAFIHSGGHAWPADLDRLVKAIEPKILTWVHTDAFQEKQ